MVLAQLLPVEPQVALDAVKATYDGFQRNFVIATVVMLIVQNVAWAWAVRGILRKLSAVEEARVADGKEWAQRLALHLDRNTEMAEALVRKATGL